MPNTSAEKEKAESIISKSSKKKKNRKKRARQWTGCVENLKTTIDVMYEMCRSEQSVAGCREAILYLQSASNDFKSLIETINVEKEWSEVKNDEKRPSVAWEVRKSMSSPSPVHLIVNAMTSDEDGWKVVVNRRRKSTSSTTVSEFDREMSVEKEEKEPLNVYERLSSSSYKRPSKTLTCPKSAMDLPQTRASMAKMAYSRQLLWEKNQQVLVEKLRAKQKKEKQKCGFTFADPQAVRKSVEAFHEQKKHQKMMNPISEKNETNEDVPADPTPSGSNVESTSLFGYVRVPEELEKDDEWRTMTEEEESLALEENSLKLEIRQAEAISIDQELERQVAVEADKLEKEAKKKQKKKEKEVETLIKVFRELMEHQDQEVHEPGTPVEKHEKMSSPSRRRCQKDDDDFGRRHEAKQKNAEILRQQLQEAKAARLKELTRRVEEVREKQEALKERKRQLMEERMQRAADNRDKNIMEVIRKAKDDDQRVMEVKFIATLQEDDKRHDLMVKEAEKSKKVEAARRRKQENARRTKKPPTPIIPAPDAPGMLEYVNSLISTTTSPTTVPTDDATWHWPSASPTTSRKCTLCPNSAEIVNSDLEAAAHLVCSKEHAEQMRTLTSGSQVEEIKRHFWGMFEKVEDQNCGKEGEGNEEEVTREKERKAARKVLEEIQTPEMSAATSPRNRHKLIRDLQKEEADEKWIEKTLIEIQKLAESEDVEQLTSSSGNVLQMCFKLSEIILEWTLPLRICLRATGILCNSRVSTGIVTSSLLLELLDKLVDLLRNQGDVTQISAILDVLAGVLTSISANSARKKARKPDFPAENALFAIGTYILTSISSSEFQKTLCQNKSLLPRILRISRLFPNPEIRHFLASQALLSVYYTRNPSEKLMTSLIENLDDLKKGGTNLVMLVVLVEHVLARLAKGVGEKQMEGERPWGTVTKDEEALLQLCTQLTRIVESMDTWQKRCLQISWSGPDQSIIESLRTLPIRLLSVEKHAARVYPLWTKILEKATNSEKAEIFGPFSSDFFSMPLF